MDGMIPWKDDCLVLRAEEVNIVGSLQKHRWLLLAFEGKAHLSWGLQRLDLRLGRVVKIKVRQMADIGRIGAILGYHNLSIVPQLYPPFIPFARLL